jgi:SAM-dependent methyltransferase
MGEMTRSAAIECNICRSEDGCQIKKGVFGNPDQNIYKCRACGHLFLAPLLDDVEEDRFYINDYPSFLLKRGDSKSTTPEEHFAKNKGEALRRLKLIKRFLSTSKRVLEIGSAGGFFLSKIKPYVKDVCGVEPNSDHLTFANSKRIETCRSLENIGDKKFDIIFLYYVLEHIKDPGVFMKNVKKLLRGSNSRIIIEVPNAMEALISLYHSPAYNEFVWQRAHCSYFSVDTLKKLFDRSGLKAEFIPEQRYDISNHIHWLVEGKAGGAGKYSHIFSKDLNKRYAESLKKKWLCDTILAIAGNSR